jgi:hypothetical protein
VAAGAPGELREHTLERWLEHRARLDGADAM